MTKQLLFRSWTTANAGRCGLKPSVHFVGNVTAMPSSAVVLQEEIDHIDPAGNGQ